MLDYWIWGIGLLGGSVAFSLKRKGYEVGGVVRREETKKFLFSRGFKHIYLPHEIPWEEVATTKGILIGTPIEGIYPILEEILKKIPQYEGWITDVASTKKELIEWVEEKEYPLYFIGSHPMAGSDKGGAENAQEDLFLGAIIYICLPSFSYKDSFYQKKVQEVLTFWKELGAFPWIISKEEHDRIGAYLSHGLHLIACIVALMVKDIPSIWEIPYYPAGQSFLDLTRVAGSNPQLWEGIIRSNWHEVENYLKSFSQKLQEMIQKVEKRELPIAKIFQEAGEIREKLHQKKHGV